MIPKCDLCGHVATDHAVDDEERRECRSCVCRQYVNDRDLMSPSSAAVYRATEFIDLLPDGVRGLIPIRALSNVIEEFAADAVSDAVDVGNAIRNAARDGRQVELSQPSRAAMGPPWLPELLTALGWQGGTIHQALEAVRRLAWTEQRRLRGEVFDE